MYIFLDTDIVGVTVLENVLEESVGSLCLTLDLEVMHMICLHESRVQGKCITNKAIPTRTTSFSKEKGAALGGTRTHDILLSRQSALPAELPGQLSKQCCSGGNEAGIPFTGIVS